MATFPVAATPRAASPSWAASLVVLASLACLAGCGGRTAATGPAPSRAAAPARAAAADTGMAAAAAPAARVPATPADTGRARMDAFVDSLLARMTLEEKVGQLTQLPGSGTVTGPAGPTGGAAAVRAGMVGSFLGLYGVDSTRVLQRLAVEESRLRIPLLFGFDVIHGFRTIFPVPLAEAGSWDTAAVRRSTRTAADEATAAGVHWTFAPMVDIARDPRWGRIVEGSGEDPYLGSAMAVARVHGFQGTDLAADSTLMATAKHYVAYGAAQGGRDYDVADISRRTLREVYMPPFHAAADAGVGSVMASFNEVNGVPMHANGALLGGVLRDAWGWRGMVVSDWAGIEELIAHGVAATPADAGRLALEAGVDMDMVDGVYARALPGLVRAGTVPPVRVDEAVRRVLRAKYRLGLFHDPYRYDDPARERAELLAPAHRAAAREVARESMVLLRNDSAALPLSKSLGTLAVVGALAADTASVLGSWVGAGRPSEAVSVLDGIRRAVGARTRVLYARGGGPTDDDTSGFAAAVAAARRADAVVLVVGETAHMSGEAASRASLGLPGAQLRLAQEVVATGRPVAVVLMNGRPLAIPWLDAHVPAILEAWYLGSENGERRGRRAVRGLQPRRQAAGDLPARHGPGADLLRPHQHGPAAEGRGQLHVEIPRRPVDAAVRVRPRAQLHHVLGVRADALRGADPGRRHARRLGGRGEHRPTRGRRGGPALHPRRGGQRHPPGDGAAAVPPRRARARRAPHARLPARPRRPFLPRRRPPPGGRARLLPGSRGRRLGPREGGALRAGALSGAVSRILAPATAPSHGDGSLDTLTVHGLSRRYGPLQVLDDIDFSVPPGSVLGVLGPNGAGKTTLLRCVVGAERPDAGVVLLEDRPLDETEPWVRAAMAAALDDMDFFPDLSVVEHLELLSFAHGGQGAVEEVVAELGLDAARDQLPATLSSGQRRRLALASCFVRPRRLLVLDEPEQRLDVRGRAWLTERLLREKAAGTAVLMASHDPELTLAVADATLELGA